MKCAIYARISVDREGQKSIKEQILQGEEFCQERGWEPVIYQDVGISGGAKHRAEFDRMVDEIAAGKIHAVFVHNQDRLAREEVTWFKFMNTLLEYEVKLYEDGNEINLEDESSRMLGGIKAIMDATFRRTTSRKIKKVLKRNASEGIFNGIKNYGYTSTKGVISIVDSEAIIIKRIFDLSESGMGINKMTKLFNDEGIPTKYQILKDKGNTKKGVPRRVSKFGVECDRDYFDSRWSAQTINRILHNRLYIGEKIWNGEKYPVPPIITEEQFNNVQQLMEKRRWKGKSTEHKYLLQGLIRCGHCERRFTGRGTGTKKSNLYRCIARRYKVSDCDSRDIHQEWLEYVIWRRLFEDGVLKDSMRKFLSEADHTEADITIAEKQIEHYTKGQSYWEAKKDKAIELVIDGILDKNELKNTLAKYDKEIKEACDFINRLQEEIKYLRHIQEKRNDAYEELEHIKDNAPYELKRRLMDKYVKNVHVRYDEPFHKVMIEYYFDMPNEIFVMDRRYRLAVEGNSATVLTLSRSAFKTMSFDELHDTKLYQQMMRVSLETTEDEFKQLSAKKLEN